MSKEEKNLQSKDNKHDFVNEHPQIVNYVAGLGAGLVSTTLGWPLDVIRIRYLFGQSTKSLFNGFTFAFLYSVGKSGLVWPIQKNVQEYVEHHFEGRTAHIISGAIGNVIPGIIFNPCNVIKVRFMESPEKTTLSQIMKDIAHKEGYSVYARGISITIFRDIMWGLMYFPLFNHMKEFLTERDKENSTIDLKEKGKFLTRDDTNSMISSAVAGSTATLLTAFLDGARLFQQKSRDPKTGHASLIGSLKMASLPSRRNLLSVTSGVGRVAITTVCGHLTYLKISKYFHDIE